MSNINYLSINENFPVAGQDNDTQTFRDNFDTIKSSLRIAKTEITALEDNSALLNADNNFNKNKIQNAVLENSREAVWDGVSAEGTWSSTSLPVDFQNGPYHIYKLGTNVNIEFTNMPGDPAIGEDSPVSTNVGKITLELYNDGTQRTVSFVTSDGAVIKKDPNFPGTLTVNSASDPVFIEAWRHDASTIYLRYLGQFS